MNQPSLELFLSACGSSEPLRLVVGERGQPHSENWTFRQPFLVIGRRPESDLMLDHWQVSRRHAYLQLIDGRYFCVDLGSRTGTHGGDSTERSGWLEQGRAIQIGPFTVRPEWPTSGEITGGPTPGVTWEMPGRAMGHALWRMDRQLALIGRSPSCKIRIVEPDVSKFHCSVVLTSLGVCVIDLLGQNGVFVNDEAVRCARLEDGDELRIGRHTLRVRYDSAPPPLPGLKTSTPATNRDLPATTTVMPGFPFLTAVPGLDLPAVRVPPRPPMVPNNGQELAALLEKSGGVVDPSVNLLVHQFGMMQQQMFDQFHNTMVMMFEGFAALHREQASTLREEFDQVRKLSEEIEALRVETARLAAASAARPPERPRIPLSPHASRPNIPPPPRTATGEPFTRATPPPPSPEVDIHAQLCARLSSIETERQTRWQKILGMMSSG